MQDLSSYERRGYLTEEFRLFHLRDDSMERIDWHYHEFHKIILLLGGNASYWVEGQRYALEPGDMVLVGSGCIHRPEIAGRLPYERVVLYLSPDFLRRMGGDGCDLQQCFRRAKEQYSFVLRPTERFDTHRKNLQALEQAMGEEGFGAPVLRRSLLLQFLVLVSRDVEEGKLRYIPAADCDTKLASVLQYLNLNLTKPISIDDLAAQFYISKFYLMRRFRVATGSTIHAYLTEKRLLLARERIAAGTPVQQACLECGFRDYSAFSRAYKKQFGTAPSHDRR